MKKTKTFLLSLLTLIIWWLPTNASPIDDASKYTVRVKSTIRYAFAEDDAGTEWFDNVAKGEPMFYEALKNNHGFKHVD